jgi:hypothetical protein
MIMMSHNPQPHVKAQHAQPATLQVPPAYIAAMRPAPRYIAVQGSAATAGLLCMLGAVTDDHFHIAQVACMHCCYVAYMLQPACTAAAAAEATYCWVTLHARCCILVYIAWPMMCNPTTSPPPATTTRCSAAMQKLGGTCGLLFFLFRMFADRSNLLSSPHVWHSTAKMISKQCPTLTRSNDRPSCQ